MNTFRCLLLALPLAMPAYVIAYAYTDALQFAGPVQTTLRAAFGWAAGDYWFPEIRSLPGAAAPATWCAPGRPPSTDGSR